MDSLEARSRDVQARTFCKWLNTKLESNDYEPMSSLNDLSDGVKLIQLMVSDVSLGRYNKNPRMRVQKAENVNKALEFITSRGVKLTNIGPEDIIDKNLKLILGMIWTLILRFTIADISEEGLSAKEGLLLWCQRKTAPYQEVNVQEFTYSWTDGLALCALIHRHRPDLLDYHSLNFADRHGNTRLAFEIAEQHLGIPQLFEVEDLCDSKPPDERSVMTYIASFFHAFSSMDQAETVSRRVEKFAELMQSVWLSKNEYERRMRKLLSEIHTMLDDWSTADFSVIPTSPSPSSSTSKSPSLEISVPLKTYHALKEHSAAFQLYKQTKKRDWISEKSDLAMLFSNIQTKLKTYNLREYVPPPGLSIGDCEAEWTGLLAEEAQRSKGINAQIREVKEALRRKFASIANDFERRVRDASAEISALDGPLEDQQRAIESIEKRLESLRDILDRIAVAEDECRTANIEENDYTVFTREDLEFEYVLVMGAVAKKFKFIDNQIVARNMTNLTPAQLEQFESTFRYFDKDESNTLSVSEMSAALASLGIVYSDDDMNVIHDELVQAYGALTFEAFINLMVDITEDQTSSEQLRDAFRGIAGEKPFVTEMDLKLAMLPPGAIEYLREAMPPMRTNGTSNSPGSNGTHEQAYDYETWLDRVFD
ncbi:hypothetical protein FRB95_010290 [Tulasnella sp. JGI-2019a]|nr:hypothetical protein FRB95_010290 [Tulasnella sp. JGI-2019a]